MICRLARDEPKARARAVQIGQSHAPPASLQLAAAGAVAIVCGHCAQAQLAALYLIIRFVSSRVRPLARRPSSTVRPAPSLAS